MKTLILMRHAKSSWKDRTLDDHDRPLNKRGRQAAPAMARWLAAQGHAPDTVLCSSARRARETLDLARAATPALPEPRIAPALDQASPSALLDELKNLPDSCTCALLIAHQPGLGELVRLLARGVRTPELKRAFAKFPTAAVAILEADIPAWNELGLETAELMDFAAPRELGGSLTAGSAPPAPRTRRLP